jgi:hypothetical protein
VFNLLFKLQRNPYRFWVHSTQAVNAVAEDAGLKLYSHKKLFFWQILIYTREA